MQNADEAGVKIKLGLICRVLPSCLLQHCEIKMKKKIKKLAAGCDILDSTRRRKMLFYLFLKYGSHF